MLIGDGAIDGTRSGQRTRAESVRHWWSERKSQQALMDLEGYGELFLHDTPLLDDPAVFRALLDRPQLTTK